MNSQGKISVILFDDELYVMLMLQRSEGSSDASKTDCDDPIVALACQTDSDACPAECKGSDEKETTDSGKVKAGDLEVSASAASRKILINGTSDLDTLTFKSSEPVEITKVILERYGYSTNADVNQVWLENENGTIISNVYDGLDSKGQAKLTIKKDYRNVDGTFNATIVLKANWAAGKTLGFKVVDVDSTAKNLNVDNYKPYEYEMVSYSGAAVTMTARGTTKDYNWESGELYEVAKFKVKAPTDSAVLVKGFTLSTSGTNQVDIRRYLDNAEVTIDGDKVSSSYEINKDDELVISFKKDVEISAKSNVEFVVKASLSDDFDDYGYSLKLVIDETADFNAIDSKTESRVTIDSLPTAWPTYTFKWGKIKRTNTRLGNVDGAQGSNDVVIAEGNITISEDIKWTLIVNIADSSTTWTGAKAIQAMRVSIWWDEYEGKVEYTNNNHDWTATFNNVEITESGKIKFMVDVRDVADYANAKLTFSFASWSTFSDFKYVEAKDKKVDIAGSISFSALTIQAARASLTNSVSKDVEFRNNESNRKVVFDGTYTAKKGDIKLNEFTVQGNANPVTGSTVTFYLSIDGEEVADAKLNGTKATSTFTNVEIDSNKSVKVVLEAEVDAKTSTWTIGKFDLILKWEDENGNTAWEATRKTVTLKVVELGSITVNTSSSEKKTVLRKTSNSVLAQFTVKPSNSASEVDLESIEFALSWDNVNTLTADDITLTIAGVTEDYSSANVGVAKPTWAYAPTTTIKSEWVVIKIELDEELTGTVEVVDLVVNNKSQSSSFSKRFEDVVVRLVKQQDVGSVTKFTVEVDGDDDITVSDLKIGTGATPNIDALKWAFNDGDTFEVAGNKDAAQMIESINYKTSKSGTSGVTILKSEFNDFFKIGDTYARILKA